MIGKRSFVGGGLLAVALLLAATTAMAGTPARHGLAQGKHRVGRGTLNTTNWAGYAAYSTSTTFTYVAGSWVVPAADCSGVKGHRTTIASAWVGLDGYLNSSRTVEQTGTDSDCLGKNSPAYYAWYEFYPAGPVFDFTDTVHAGDHMTASVTVTGENVETTIEDYGQDGSALQWTYPASSNSISTAGLALNSAEWILERPSHSLTSLPGGVTFTGATATTVAGGAGSIASFSPNYDSVIMVSNLGRHPKTLAAPENLSSSGAQSSFDITENP